MYQMYQMLQNGFIDAALSYCLLLRLCPLRYNESIKQNGNC